MRISKIFSLQRSQPELDFVDIDVNRDLELFVDPYLLAIVPGPWAQETAQTIREFFHHFFDLLRTGDDVRARQMFDYLHEPNETCLGMSRGAPDGRGIGQDNAADLFDSMKSSRAVASGLVTDLEDAEVFISGIGPDKVSDMVTNVIRGQLIRYTQKQCALWNMPMRAGTPTGFYWDRIAGAWTTSRTDMLIVEGRKILLVPKWGVSRRRRSPKDVFHSEYVIEYEQNENIRLNSALVQRRASGVPYVTKRSLIAAGVTASKSYLADWAARHKETLEKFRTRIRVGLAPLSHDDLMPASTTLADVCVSLRQELASIQPGKADANRYHHCIAAILDLLFYPDLANPGVEERLHEGRKRIDILFDNMASEGFFAWVHTRLEIECAHVVAECKNYAEDPANPELDQIIGQLGDRRGRLGFLVCRTADDLPLLVKRCHDAFADGHGLIIPLVDGDLIQMLEVLSALAEADMGNSRVYGEIVMARARQIALG